MDPSDDRIDKIDQDSLDGKNYGHRANTKQDQKKKKGSAVMKRLRKSFRRFSCVSKNAEEGDEKNRQENRPYERQSNDEKINNNHHQQQTQHQQGTNKLKNNQEKQRVKQHQYMEQERLPPLATSEDLSDHSSNGRQKQLMTASHILPTIGNNSPYDDKTQKHVVVEQQRNHPGYIQRGNERLDSSYKETVSAQSYGHPAQLTNTHNQKPRYYGNQQAIHSSTPFGQSNNIYYTIHTQHENKQYWQLAGDQRNVKIYLQTPKTHQHMTHNMRQTDFENEYDFTHKKRGIAVLIIMKTFENNAQPARPLAVNDQNRMIELFKELGFDIEVIEDAKSEELINKLKAIRNRIATSDYDCDCFACVISSHGEEIPSSHIHKTQNVKLREQAICTFNGVVLLRDIINLFEDGAEMENGKLFRSLKGKPKLFFIQACRAIFGKSNEESIDPGISVKVDFGPPFNYNQLNSQPEKPCLEQDEDELNPGMVSFSKEIKPLPPPDVDSNNATLSRDNLPESYSDSERIQDKASDKIEDCSDTSCKMIEENISTKTDSHMDAKYKFDSDTNTYRVVEDSGPTTQHSIIYNRLGNSPVNQLTGGFQHSPSYRMPTNYHSGPNPEYQQTGAFQHSPPHRMPTNYHSGPNPKNQQTGGFQHSPPHRMPTNYHSGPKPVNQQTIRIQHSPHNMQTNYQSGPNPAPGIAFNYGGQHSTSSSRQSYSNEYQPTHLGSHNASLSPQTQQNTRPTRDLDIKLEDTLKFMDELCSSQVKDPHKSLFLSTQSPVTQTSEQPKEPVEYCDIPCSNDCLVMYTAPSGYIGWTTGDKENFNINDIAGWIPYCLYNILSSCWNNKTLLEVLTEANYIMVQKLSALYQGSYYKSVGQIDHRLLKDVIFRPKL